MWLNQKGVAFSVCSFTQLIPRTVSEVASASQLWASLLEWGISQHWCYLECDLLVTYYPIAPAIIFCYWIASQQVYFLPLWWNGSGWCCWDVAAITALPESSSELFLISSDNCCIRKHFLCPSRTLRLHPKIQNRGVEQLKKLTKSTWSELLLIEIDVLMLL